MRNRAERRYTPSSDVRFFVFLRGTVIKFILTVVTVIEEKKESFLQKAFRKIPLKRLLR